MLPAHHSVKDTAEDIVWAVDSPFLDFTRAAVLPLPYDDRYGVMLAWGGRSPCTDYVGRGARRERGFLVWNSSAGARGDEGRRQLSPKSRCCSLLRLERGRGGVRGRQVVEGERCFAFFFSHSRILTPPCGDWAPWETPLGGAGPNSNRFTKLQEDVAHRHPWASFRLHKKTFLFPIK